MTALLEAQGLNHRFTAGGPLALTDISLSIAEGECVGLVGESGCGKSTLSRLLARLVQPSEGTILFSGTDITAIPLRRFYAAPERARIQVVFQDPTESLNPSLTVFQAIADPIRRLVVRDSGDGVADRVYRALDLVGLPRDFAPRLPHQLSGGQRARVGIARAIAVEPKLLILDEPTSALDVSVQSVILRLLDDLKTQLGMSYLFVSHDLNVVRLLCDRIIVMYRGRIVEEAAAEAIFTAPQHAYTQQLLAAIPNPDRRRSSIEEPQ